MPDNSKLLNYVYFTFNHFIPSKEIMSLRCNGLLGVEENKNDLVRRNGNKRRGFRKIEERN